MLRTHGVRTSSDTTLVPTLRLRHAALFGIERVGVYAHHRARWLRAGNGRTQKGKFASRFKHARRERLAGAHYGGTEGRATRYWVGVSTNAEQSTGEAITRATGHAVARNQYATQLGRYVVLGRAGSGGMGEVYRAYDPKLQREVALKMVHADQLDQEARARIVREARAMARINHPNVVAVYDVNQDQSEGVGLVLVMEFVPGQTLRRWLREKPRAWNEILSLFVAAGRGLHAAHREGVLHRDFKPANVLVSTDGSTKVTDFGLAKPTTARWLEATDDYRKTDEFEVTPGELTRNGDVMGTPRYMAPEQHAGSPQCAATDQYAFAVALWEALNGQAPFAGPSLVADKRICRLPEWTNARVPAAIARALRRALCVDPTVRWPSMEAMLEALAPPRRASRIRLAALGSAAALGGLFLPLAGSSAPPPCTGAQARLFGVWDPQRRTNLASTIRASTAGYAHTVATQTEASLEEFAAAWVQVHTDACEATSVRGEQSEALLDLRMACLHESRTELGAVVDVLTTGDAEVLARAHHAVAGLSPLSRCADLEALQEGATGPSAAEAEPVDRVRALIAKSNAQNKAGRFEDAKNTMNAATTMAEVIDYRPLQTELMLAQSVVESNLGNHLAAQAALRRVLSLGMPQRQWSLVRRAATDLISLVGRELGLPEQGLQYRELAAGLARNDPDALSDLHLHVGLALQTAGQYAESEIEYRAALAMIESRPNAKPQHIASARAYIANALHRQGNFELAAAEQRAVLSIRLEQFGPNHPSVASTRSDLAMALVRLERYDEAAPEAALALQIRVAALGPDHPMTGEAYNNMGVLNLRRGDATAAAAAFRAGLEIHERGLNPEHPKLLTDRANLASALLGSGDYQGAGDIFRTLIPLQQKAMGDEHPLVAVTTQNLAVSLYSLGRFDEAITEYQRALAIQIKALGEQHPKVAMIRTNLADALWQYDRTDEALEVAKLAWARRQQTDIPAAKRASTAFLLARITLAAQPKNLAEARALALLAQQAAPEGDAELRDGIAGWLAEHG